MKNILVVGGAGYIGGALTDRLMDYNLRVYDNLLYDNIYRKPVDFVFGDIRDTSKLKKQLEASTDLRDAEIGFSWAGKADSWKSTNSPTRGTLIPKKEDFLRLV